MGRWFFWVHLSSFSHVFTKYVHLFLRIKTWRNIFLSFLNQTLLHTFLRFVLCTDPLNFITRFIFRRRSSSGYIVTISRMLLDRSILWLFYSDRCFHVIVHFLLFLEFHHQFPDSLLTSFDLLQIWISSFLQWFFELEISVHIFFVALLDIFFLQALSLTLILHSDVTFWSDYMASTWQPSLMILFLFHEDVTYLNHFKVSFMFFVGELTSIVGLFLKSCLGFRRIHTFINRPSFFNMWIVGRRSPLINWRDKVWNFSSIHGTFGYCSQLYFRKHFMITFRRWTFLTFIRTYATINAKRSWVLWAWRVGLVPSLLFHEKVDGII